MATLATNNKMMATLEQAFNAAVRFMATESAVASVGIEWQSPEGNKFSADIVRDVIGGVVVGGHIRNVKRIDQE